MISAQCALIERMAPLFMKWKGLTREEAIAMIKREAAIADEIKETNKELDKKESHV